jgi:replication initiation protein RepC
MSIRRAAPLPAVVMPPWRRVLPLERSDGTRPRYAVSWRGLRAPLHSSEPNWRDIVDAADWLRHDLDISKSLWGEACIAMGRETAAIALAIVSVKPAGYFRTTAGGYFHGMVAKAKAGELNLGRTIWSMRSTGRPDSKRRPRYER